MSTNKSLTQQNKELGNLGIYFDELPQNLQDVVFNWISQFETYDETPESFECRGRHGFIPYSHNKGGLQITRYGCLFDYLIGDPGHCIELDDEVQKKINKLIEQSMEYAVEDFVDAEPGRAEELSDLGLTWSDINYSSLENISADLANEFGNLENEHLKDEYSSTLSTLRVMYNGGGSWTIDAMFNFSDAPYHRGCDQVRTWTIETLMPEVLKDFLESITKEVSMFY